MTRRSKREIERTIAQIEAVEGSSPSSTDRTTLEDRYPEDVVYFVRSVARDLLRICHHNADTVVNAPDPDATMAYLEIVRERYGINDDRDDAVRRALEGASEGVDRGRPFDPFTMAPVTLAIHLDLATDDGDSLEHLVDAGRNREAERLLVQTAYDVFANID